MNFFEHQDAARKLTRRFVWMFLFAIVVIIVVLVLVVTTLVDIFVYKNVEAFSGVGSYISYLFTVHLSTIGLVSLAVLAVVGGASLIRLIRLSQGGHVVADMMGARKVDLNTRDPHERMLINVVDEMAIASGTSRPGVYIMEDTSINAFAAGYSADNAVVAVTTGTLYTLNREELQGVIAHEFSHILNGDMRLNIRLLGVLAGILLIGNIGYYMLHGAGHTRSSRDNRGAAVIFAAGIAMVVVGFIGVLCGRMIQSSVSRQREYLADASAVQFTRNPDGIAGALNKIRLLPDGSFVSGVHSAELNHMCFGETVPIRFMSGLMASHPPLDERITRIKPDFDLDAIIKMPDAYNEQYAANNERGSAERVASAAGESGTGRHSVNAGVEAVSNLAGSEARVNRFSSSTRSVNTNTAEVMSEVGTVSAQQVEMGTAMRLAIPQPLHEALTSEEGARAVVYCLVLDLERRTRERQVNLVVNEDNNNVAKLAWALWDHVNALGLAFRQPLLDLAMGVISYSDSPTREKMGKTLREIIMFDGTVDFSELIVMLAVAPQLEDNHLKATRNKYRFLPKLNAELCSVFGLLAMAGSNNERQWQIAFDVAINHIGLSNAQFPGKEQISFGILNKAMSKLRALIPAKKQLVFEACVEMVLHDEEVTLREYEMIRLLAKALECPLPVSIAGAA